MCLACGKSHFRFRSTGTFFCSYHCTSCCLLQRHTRCKKSLESFRNLCGMCQISLPFSLYWYLISFLPLYQLLLTAFAYTLQEKFRVIPKFQIHESVNERIGYVIDNIHMIQEDNSWSLCIGQLFPEIWRYAFDD